MKRRGDLIRMAQRCALAVMVAALCYLLFGLIGTRCLFRQITGLPCLTCGMSRAWLCALRLDFAGAFFWHPLFWSVPLIALTLIFFGARRRRVRQGLIAFLILFLAVYAVRMAFLFPTDPPMTLEPDALFPRLLNRYF